MKTIFLFILFYISNLLSQTEKLNGNFLAYSFGGIAIRMEETEFLKIFPMAELISNNGLEKRYELQSSEQGFFLDCKFIDSKLKSSSIGLFSKSLEKIGGLIPLLIL